MRNINISEQEIDNFLDTEEGEAMTQPEYRVIQALLATRRGEAADEIDAKKLRRRGPGQHSGGYSL